MQRFLAEIGATCVLREGSVIPGPFASSRGSGSLETIAEVRRKPTLPDFEDARRSRRARGYCTDHVTDSPNNLPID